MPQRKKRPAAPSLTPPVPTEHSEQAALIEWTSVNHRRYPGLDLIHAIPNGAFKSRAAAAKFRAEGLKAGVPDLFLPVARNGYHGLYIEMKRTKNGRLSDEQRQWLYRLGREGYATTTAYGWTEAVAAIENYYTPLVPKAI